MSSQPTDNPVMIPSVEEIASEVSAILLRRLNAGKSGADIVKLLQIILLDSQQAAEFLGVKPKTVSTWVSQGKIPVRYVNSDRASSRSLSSAVSFRRIPARGRSCRV